MKIGVIGGGRVGSALAATWQERGHEVVVSTRDTIAETSAAGDVVVLAVPAAAAPDVLSRASLDGKVVVDATNNLSGGPSSAEIAALAPEARIVKAFNTVFSTFMHDTPPSPPASLVYAGDDAEAKATVAQLISDAGFEPVDAGSSEAVPLVEAFAKLVIRIAYVQGRGPFVYRFQAN
jgi:predicted dinucleotide-binding enzyme